VIAREVIAIVLLASAALIVVASSIGICVMPGAYRKLHYVTPAALVAPVGVVAAIFVWTGLSENTGESIVALAFMAIAGPFLSHATLRAIRAREQGSGEQGSREEREK
jgi:multisubunit Na+/H+ antiporter MnhG subunit